MPAEPSRPPVRVVRPVAAALLAALLLVVGFPASARADEVFTPANGKVLVIGHGWGHGKGMSQYGAKRGAEEGASSAQILDFYYPGTAVGSASGQIRVRLDGAIGNPVRFKPSQGFEIYDTGHAEAGGSVPPGEEYEVRVDGAGKQHLYHRVGSTWTLFRSLLAEAWVQAGAPFEVVGGVPAGAGVRGAVHVVTRSVSGGGYTLWPVNHLDLEHYLYGVVGSEMPSSWPAAAVQSQAVAARTYAQSVRGGQVHDICSTTQCQVYRGTAGENQAIINAVEATRGQIRTWEGKPAFTQYSSSTGGWLAPGTVPYQVGKEDRWDWESSNPYRDWSVELTVDQISQAYPNRGTLERVVVTSRNGFGEWGGRVSQLRLEFPGDNDVVVSGDGFRSRFGLRSTYYTFVTPCGDGRFRDVPGGSQFCGDIIWMTDRGLTTGYGDGTYRPTAPVTRQALAAFLWRYEGQPAAQSTEPHFADVDATHPFFTAIQWMYESGASTGTPQEGGKPLFKWADPVSRQALAAFLWRFEDEPAPTATSDHFADVDATNAFYAAIQWMFESGLSTGTPQAGGAPVFKPVDPLSRQAVAAFLHRYDGLGGG